MKLPPDFAPSRIVVLRPRGLGDVVLATAVVDALSRAWPDAAIDFVVERVGADLLSADGRLERLFLLGPSLEGDRMCGGGTLQAVRWVRDARADLVVDLFSNPRTALLTASSGAPYRIGLDKRLRRFAYNVRVPRFRGDPEHDHRYAKEVQLDFLRAAGVRWEGKARASIALADDDRTAASRVLAELGYGATSRFAAVLPGGSWESKRWSTEGYAACGLAAAKRLGSPALVLWGPPEEREARRIATSLGASGRLPPATTLRQMAAILARAAVLVSADCLGRHLAIVQDVPTLGVFGGTDPRDWTPPGGLHRTVRASKEQGYETLRQLRPEPVVALLHELLDEVDSIAAGT